MAGRRAGRISEPALTIVTGTLGLTNFKLNGPARPLRNSPSLLAVSIPVGPPPVMTMLLAVGSAFRNAVQFVRKNSSSQFRPSKGEVVDAPVAITRA